MAEEESTGVWNLTTQLARTLKDAAFESYTAVTANGTYVFLNELITSEEECLRTDFDIPEVMELLYSSSGVLQQHLGWDILLASRTRRDYRLPTLPGTQGLRRVK
ncbi:Hypp5623 [Branchiostoma lanceolatum]|uniref:Hypp5623 protein n=1 Tax=Branchiostoma lanceolatum TaxID=7740 RepID=A0A8J9W3V0_BRALA|nr:Hypp5623 [Branchiostoma lanceolatum]